MGIWDGGHDPETMPEAKLLALPEEASPAGALTAFFARRAEIVHQRDADDWRSSCPAIPPATS